MLTTGTNGAATRFDSLCGAALELDLHRGGSYAAVQQRGLTPLLRQPMNEAACARRLARSSSGAVAAPHESSSSNSSLSRVRIISGPSVATVQGTPAPDSRRMVRASAA